MESTVSVAGRCLSTSFISTTNYMEALFAGSENPELCYTLQEFVAAKKPPYLLINFSNTGLTLSTDATASLYTAIVNQILSVSPETTVILSGPLPLTADSGIHKNSVLTLDETLATLAGNLHKNGLKVYYLASPISFFTEDQMLNPEFADENGNLNLLGCETYFNYVLRHPVVK
jgi:hypothetical protein